MDTSQSDRDALRAFQQQRANPQTIGNIVENRTQDPKKYNQLPKRKVNSIHDSDSIKSNINYISKHLKAQNLDDAGESPITRDVDLPISQEEIETNSWLNMDQVEFDKLEWMTSKGNAKLDEQNFNCTKFNLDGKVVIGENLVDGSEKSGEMHYDINSLITFLDSTYPPQIAYALRVITNIANLATRGFYDGVFNENIHQVLIKNCLLRVRHQMDNSNETICLQALACMRSLLCNTQVDEFNLDRIFPLITHNAHEKNLWLSTNEMLSKEFTIDMKDSECVEIDVVRALIVRTEILPRFLYLLDMKTGKLRYYFYILDILTRIARHSLDTCCLLNNKELLTTIKNLFLPIGITNETKTIRPLTAKALKLIRIILEATRELQIKQQLERKQTNGRTVVKSGLQVDIIDVLQSYFIIDWFNSMRSEDQDSDLIKINIESIRIIKFLYLVEPSSEQIIGLISLNQPKLFSSVKELARLNSTDPISSSENSLSVSPEWIYAAHLIDLVGMFYKKVKDNLLAVLWDNYIKIYFNQWVIDVVNKKYIPHVDVSIALNTAFQHLDSYDSFSNKILFNEQNLDANVAFFCKLMESADQNSQLSDFLEKNGRLRDPKGLPSYGTLNFNTSAHQQQPELCSLIVKNSPYLLINMFLTKLQQASSSNNLGNFLDNITFMRYLRKATSYYSFDSSHEILVQQSPMAQFEIDILAKSLILLVNYYFKYTDTETGEGVELNIEESPELANVRVECYSNLCFYAIALIGIFNEQQVFSGTFDLKEQLLEKVLLNSTLQHRLAKENFIKNKQKRSESMYWLGEAFKDGFSLEERPRYYFSLTPKHLRILIPFYTSVTQNNRNWILEPLVFYYLGQTSNDEKFPKQEHWFSRNIVWKNHNGDLNNSNDSSILAKILDFHLAMLLYSPSYNRCAVRPNVEECLCTIGCLFLHDDIFLDTDINQSLKYNLRYILNDCINSKSADENGAIDHIFKDASKLIKPLNLTLGDFFNKLVEQFEAVSYGDETFTNYLLLFLATGSDKVFRKKLFQEKVETCLSQLRIKSANIWAPKELFFSKPENDPEIRGLLERASPFIRQNSFLQDYKNFHTN